MRVRLCLFDFNGTLFDDLSVVYGSVAKIFRRYGLKPPTLDEYRDEITADFMKFYYNHGIPAGVTAKDLNAIRKEYLEAHWSEPRIHIGAERSLILCKRMGMKTAIVSAEMQNVLEKRLQDLKMIPCLDLIVGSAYKKQEALLSVLDRLETRAEEAVYVDDTFDGITAAKEIGIKTIGFCNGYNSRRRIFEAGPDYPNPRFPEVLTHEDIMQILFRMVKS